MSRHLSSTGESTAAARKIRVVIVDDSSPTLLVMGRFLLSLFPLQIAGQAESGLEALALADRLQPDLVITDLKMPDITGFQLVERLRQVNPGIRSIITSAHDGSMIREESLRRGADAFISKQSLPDELPGVLSRLFPEAPETGRFNGPEGAQP